ncbi:MAG: dienelactone hydrolase family protein [Gammaproteobacteria bacterium]|nr:dienelactone hydrolase family protein [Gammaproteobacteria bacterium]
MDRRTFLSRAAALGIAGGLAMATSLLPRYAEAAMIKFTDSRIKATYVEYESPGGNSGRMRGYLVQPTGGGPFPAVIVIHENRGLNPHIEDVARRAAVEGFLAFAPDGLYPIGGYPGNDEDGKVMQNSLDREKLFIDLMNGAKFVKAHSLSNGKLGATGFCYGGGVTNALAVQMGADLQAGAPFYGAAARAEDVDKIQAPLLIHYAEDDKRINAMKAGYESALKAAGKSFESHVYPGTRHGFHNNSTPRFNEVQARIAWERTIAHFNRHLT